MSNTHMVYSLVEPKGNTESATYMARAMLLSFIDVNNTAA